MDWDLIHKCWLEVNYLGNSINNMHNLWDNIWLKEELSFTMDVHLLKLKVKLLLGRTRMERSNQKSLTLF